MKNSILMFSACSHTILLFGLYEKLKVLTMKTYKDDSSLMTILNKSRLSMSMGF